MTEVENDLAGSKRDVLKIINFESVTHQYSGHVRVTFAWTQMLTYTIEAAKGACLTRFPGFPPPAAQNGRAKILEIIVKNKCLISFNGSACGVFFFFFEKTRFWSNKIRPERTTFWNGVFLSNKWPKVCKTTQNDQSASSTKICYLFVWTNMGGQSNK